MFRRRFGRLSWITLCPLPAILLSAILNIHLHVTVILPSTEQEMGAGILGSDGLPPPNEHPSESSPSVEVQGRDKDGGKSTSKQKLSILNSTRFDINNSFSHGGTITDPSQHPPRVLLGVFPTGSRAYNLRQIFRAIYSEFNEIHISTPSPNRFCSLGEFTKKKVDEWGPYECQLVYAFLLGGNDTRTKIAISPGQWKTLPGSVEIPGSPEMQTLLQKEAQSNKLQTETDVLIFNANDDNSQHILWSWHQYVFSHWNGIFDFIAHSSPYVIFEPQEFWQNRIFSQPHGSPNNSSSQSVMCEHESMSLMSFDLVEKLASTDPQEAYGSGDFSITLPPINITVGTLKGISTTNRSNFELLYAWDRFKDSIIKAEGGYQDIAEVARVEASEAIKYFNDPNRTFSGPRMLMGIFTMDSQKEQGRRAVVRGSYLSYYKKSGTRYRICSLLDLLNGVLPKNGADCQMAYVFVMGSNPNGPTELLEPNSTFPLTISSGNTTGLEDEVDILHLNIRENMEDGKSPTWFKYASTVIGEQVYFDYVGKTDTDTMIHPDKFLDETLAMSCPAFPDNARLYGGIYREQDSRFPIMIGPCYFAGELYWMSSYLARFVSSSELDRKAVDPWIEDLAMGNFVHSHPLPIRRVAEPEHSYSFHKHPIKKRVRYRREWVKWLGIDEESPGGTTYVD